MSAMKFELMSLANESSVAVELLLESSEFMAYFKQTYGDLSLPIETAHAKVLEFINNNF